MIDHSVQVDAFGSPDALEQNAALEFERNRERYEFLRWGQKAFRNFRVVPPATGIVHQVNLEYLAKGVLLAAARRRDGRAARHAGRHRLAHDDDQRPRRARLGRGRHRGRGRDARPAALHGDAAGGRLPPVGQLREGATATDLVLTVTQMLRKKGVVEKFVEFYGPGLVADEPRRPRDGRQHGARVRRHLRLLPGRRRDARATCARTGRSDDEVDLVERYCKEQGLFRTDASPEPVFTDTLELDLATVEPSLAGPEAAAGPRGARRR